MQQKSARARFSTWQPPRKAKKKVEAAIVERKKKPEPEKSATTAALAKEKAMLKGVDLSDLDDVELSDEHRQLVATLLEDLEKEDLEKDEPQEEDEVKPLEGEALIVVAYLTRRLSFKTEDAENAARSGEGIGGALDWLCLKLDDDSLAEGLQRQKKPQPLIVVNGGDGVTLSSAFDFAEQTKVAGLQALLGLSQSEATKAVRAVNGDDDLAVLRAIRDLAPADDGEALEVVDERLAEGEALRAIFGDDNVSEEKTGVVWKLGLDLNPEELKLRPPAARSRLSVLAGPTLGAAYPSAGAPILLFENAALPPSCLRLINTNLNKFAAKELHSRPALFDALDWLKDNAPQAQKSFVKEFFQREEAKPPPPPKEDVRRWDHVEKAQDAAFERQADDAGRVAFLKSVNADGDVVKARKAAETARRHVLGLPVDDDDDDDASSEEATTASEAPKEPKQEDGILTAVMEATGASAEVARSLVAQASSKRDVVQEAVRLHRLRVTPDEEAKPTSRVLAASSFSPLLQDIAAMLRDTVDDQPWLLQKEEPEPEPEPSSSEAIQGREHEESRALKAELDEKRANNGAYKGMLQQRSRLPAYKMRHSIVAACRKHRVVIVCGDTGSGKTTQVPQLILDDYIDRGMGARCSMVVTQPRRISAVGVAARVADERAEVLGETVGYSIRGETKRSKKTRLLLCTTGVLLRRMQCDADLETLSHVFVDEVHERDLNTDFLLIILRELLMRRPSLHLILMSATVNAELFAKYFSKFDATIVQVPGRAHPVEARFLEDALEITEFHVDPRSDCAVGNSRKQREESAFVGLTKRQWASKLPDNEPETHRALAGLDPRSVNYDLIVKLVQRIHDGTIPPPSGERLGGAILIFLPGILEIATLVEKLDDDSLEIYPLHSGLSAEDQRGVFSRPQKKKRKVVVATNIAETSITIDDVVFVIDAARVKENRYDSDRGMATLEEVWVSRASARQRRGRAGRVQPGIAYHLVSRCQHDSSEFDDYPQPEMQRTSLDQLVLQILVLDLGDPQKFLQKAVDPPTRAAVDRAIDLLQGIDALEPFEEDDNPVAALTALGYHLASLPVEPRVGKLLLVGTILGVCGPTLTLCAVMTSSRSVFVSPLDKREEADSKRRTFAVAFSDHLTAVAAYDAWRCKKRGDARKFVRDNFLSHQTLESIDQARIQFKQQLETIGFLKPGSRLENRSGLIPDGHPASDEARGASLKSVALLKAILCAGLYPNVLIAPRDLVVKHIVPGKKKSAGELSFQRQCAADEDTAAYLHPCCLNFHETSLDHRTVVFRELVRTSKIYVRDATTVPPLAVLLFGGAITVHHEKDVVSVDGRIHFHSEAKTATLVKILRRRLDDVCLEKITSPFANPTPRDLQTTAAIRKILGADGIRLEQRQQQQRKEDPQPNRSSKPPPQSSKKGGDTSTASSSSSSSANASSRSRSRRTGRIQTTTTPIS